MGRDGGIRVMAARAGFALDLAVHADRPASLVTTSSPTGSWRERVAERAAVLAGPRRVHVLGAEHGGLHRRVPGMPAGSAMSLPSLSACRADQIRALYGDADDLHPDLALLLPTSRLHQTTPRWCGCRTRNLQIQRPTRSCPRSGCLSGDRALTTPPAAYSYGLSGNQQHAHGRRHPRS